MREFLPGQPADIDLPSTDQPAARPNYYATPLSSPSEIEAAAKHLDALYLEAQRGDARVTWQEVAAAGLKLRHLAFGRDFDPGMDPAKRL